MNNILLGLFFLILGLLFENMLTNVCGCKNLIEGQQCGYVLVSENDRCILKQSTPPGACDSIDNSFCSACIDPNRTHDLHRCNHCCTTQVTPGPPPPPAPPSVPPVDESTSPPDCSVLQRSVRDSCLNRCDKCDVNNTMTILGNCVIDNKPAWENLCPPDTLSPVPPEKSPPVPEEAPVPSSLGPTPGNYTLYCDDNQIMFKSQ